jgi:hypothetical protein
LIAGGIVVVSFLAARAVGIGPGEGRPETVGAFLMVVGEALRRTVRADQTAGRAQAELPVDATGDEA